MIHKDLIDRFDVDTRRSIREAFNLIAHCGIIELQRERLLESLRRGAQDEDDETLRQRILIWRRDESKLLELKQLGESIKQENES